MVPWALDGGTRGTQRGRRSSTLTLPPSSQAHLEKLIAHQQGKIVCIHNSVIRPSARGIFIIINGGVHYNRFCIVTQVDLFITR